MAPSKHLQHEEIVNKQQKLCKLANVASFVSNKLWHVKALQELLLGKARFFALPICHPLPQVKILMYHACTSFAKAYLQTH